MSDWFTEVLAKYKRIAVTGPALSGKTTLCERVHDRQVIHTDSFMHLPWSECSLAVKSLVNADPGPLVVEGVRVPHALRKGMSIEVVIWLERMTKWAHDSSRHEKAGHETQEKAMWTVLCEWRQTSSVPVIIQGGRPLREALPVQLYPEPNDFDVSDKRRSRR